MYQIDKSHYIKKYKKRMLYSMEKINPKWDPDDVEKILDKMIQKRLQNPVIEMDNNYTGEHKEASLISVFDWALQKEPIIAGNGTFYKNQHQAYNPIAQMLDNMLTTRKQLKKEMFKIEDTNSYEYTDLDLAQMNEKINANS